MYYLLGATEYTYISKYLAMGIQECTEPFSRFFYRGSSLHFIKKLQLTSIQLYLTIYLYIYNLRNFIQFWLASLR